MFNETQFARQLEAIDAGHYQPTQLITIPVDQASGPNTIKVRGNLFQILASTLRQDLTGFVISDTTARIYIRFNPTGCFLPFSLNPATNPALSAYSGPFSQIDWIVRATENHAGGVLAFMVGLNVGVGWQANGGTQLGSSNSYIA